MLSFFNELFHNLSTRNECKNSNFIDELQKSVKKEPLFTLDRLEENFAVLENRSNGEMLNVDSSLISKEATVRMYS